MFSFRLGQHFHYKDLVTTDGLGFMVGNANHVPNVPWAREFTPGVCGPKCTLPRMLPGVWSAWKEKLITILTKTPDRAVHVSPSPFPHVTSRHTLALRHIIGWPGVKEVRLLYQTPLPPPPNFLKWTVRGHVSSNQEASSNQTTEGLPVLLLAVASIIKILSTPTAHLTGSNSQYFVHSQDSTRTNQNTTAATSVVTATTQNNARLRNVSAMEWQTDGFALRPDGTTNVTSSSP